MIRVLLVVFISVLTFSTTSWAEKDSRFKKSEVSQEVAQNALQIGTIDKMGGVKFSRVIPQSISVSGVHQVEDSNIATIYYSFVSKGSESAKYATEKAVRFNSGYWYFPSSKKFLQK